MKGILLLPLQVRVAAAGALAVQVGGEEEEGTASCCTTTASTAHTAAPSTHRRAFAGHERLIRLVLAPALLAGPALSPAPHGA